MVEKERESALALRELAELRLELAWSDPIEAAAHRVPAQACIEYTKDHLSGGA